MLRPAISLIRLPYALPALLVAGVLACGWELGLPDREATRASADRERVERPPAAEEAVPAGAEHRSHVRPVADDPSDRLAAPDRVDETAAPVAGPVIGSLPDRARPDTIGVLLPRHTERRVAGIDVDDYLLWLPPGLERGDTEWPLLLWLHGRSLRGNDLNRLKRYGPPALLARGGSLPFVVVAPQLPPDGRWADLDPVAAIVDEIVARYPIDRDRIYLMGFSMGGGGAYRMAFTHGSRFAAMIALAGHTPPPTEENVAAVASLPFLAIHGERDVRVPLPPAERMANALATSGAPLFEFRMAPGMNHSRLERLTRDEDLFRWLLSHRRSRVAAARASARR